MSAPPGIRSAAHILSRHALECTLLGSMTCPLRVISQLETHLHHPTANIRNGSVSTNKLHKTTENSRRNQWIFDLKRQLHGTDLR